MRMHTHGSLRLQNLAPKRSRTHPVACQLSSQGNVCSSAALVGGAAAQPLEVPGHALCKGTQAAALVAQQAAQRIGRLCRVCSLGQAELPRLRHACQPGLQHSCVKCLRIQGLSVLLPSAEQDKRSGACHLDNQHSYIPHVCMAVCQVKLTHARQQSAAGRSSDTWRWWAAV